ncbi:MAG: hypothetical protein WKI04_03965 [Ferruginibacter sp.]
MAADAYHLTSTHPGGESAYLAMIDVPGERDNDASQFLYIIAHAISTSMVDQSELEVIARVLEKRT